MQGTLKAKVGAEMGRYRILGVCNPRFAHEALEIEDKLGVLLLCNVIVREMPDGRVAAGDRRSRGVTRQQEQFR